MSSLTHLDDDGRARMIDVGAKPVTRRVARAAGRLDTTAEVDRARPRATDLPKADVLRDGPHRRHRRREAHERADPARAHPAAGLGDDRLRVRAADAILIDATVSVTARTGVEMEALTAVAIAGLTLHDMIKAVDPRAVLGEIRLLEKSRRQARRVDAGPARMPQRGIPSRTPPHAPHRRGLTAAVLVSSTGAAAGHPRRHDRAR